MTFYIGNVSFNLKQQKQSMTWTVFLVLYFVIYKFIFATSLSVYARHTDSFLALVIFRFIIILAAIATYMLHNR